MTDQRDYGDESDRCTCRKWKPDPDCPIHGRPGQLTLQPVEGHRLGTVDQVHDMLKPEHEFERIDPATAE